MRTGVVVLCVAALAASTVRAQVRAPTEANPLQTLPQASQSNTQSNIDLQVQTHNNDQLAALLSTVVTPRRIDINGVHSIAFDEVASLFKPLTGKQVRIADLVAAADACTRIYQSRGYALSFCFVPAQSFADGVVKVVAVEGYVADVTVDGSPGELGSKIRDISAHITADRPLRKSTFDRYIQILGMLPGVHLAASVPLPTTTDGATHLKLTVTHKSYDVTSGINFNQPGVQGVLGGQLNALTPLGEQVNASMLLPKGLGSQSFYSGSYQQMLGSNGLIGKLEAMYYAGNPDTDHQLPWYYNHRLKQNRDGASLSYPLILTGNSSLTLHGGFYASNALDRYFNTLNGILLELRNDVRVINSGLTWLKITDKQTRKIDFTVSHGLDVLGAHADTIVTPPGTVTRGITDLTFTRYNLDALQSNDWGHHLVTVLSVTGQYSSTPLPSTEQISFGGPRYGLAYDPGTISGDSGWGASAELNRPFTIASGWLKTLTPYITVQAARVYAHELPVPLTTNYLETVALGTRFSDGKHYTIDLSVAQPVGDHPPYGLRRDPRVNLSFSYQLSDH